MDRLTRMPCHRNLARTLLLLIALGISLNGTAAPDGVVVVRHAEKVDDGTNDPGLSEAGRERAHSLSQSLRKAEIAGLIATQYQRTQQTLSSLAEHTGLEIITVPAEPGGTDAHIAEVVWQVKNTQASGLLVIAGHSNTVPSIVEALSGQSVPPLDETDYDHMFILLPARSGMTIVTARYGDKTQPGGDAGVSR